MSDLLLKTCKSCGIDKSLTDFYKKTKTSYRNPCKACHNIKTKEWVRDNPERRREIAKAWDDRNNEERLSRMSSYRKSNPPKALWFAARNRAQKFGLPFSISVEDIVIPDVCPVFGCKLEIHTGQAGGEFNSPSLDKINPELGYVPGNVQVISRLANTMKNNASEEELIQFANWILKTNGNK